PADCPVPRRPPHSWRADRLLLRPPALGDPDDGGDPRRAPAPACSGSARRTQLPLEARSDRRRADTLPPTPGERRRHALSDRSTLSFSSSRARRCASTVFWSASFEITVE